MVDAALAEAAADDARSAAKRAKERAKEARADADDLKAMVLTKLNAAKGGGYIVQSDHSVPSNISGENYDTVVRLVREYGRYPLQLGEYDLPDLT